MKLKIILSVIIALLGCATIGAGYSWHESAKQNKQFLNIIQTQAATIDSLTNNPAQSLKIDLELNVTDKSKYSINAKGNNGTITAPTEKIYKLNLKIDSVSMTTTAK